MKVIVLLSGGMDSTTALALTRKEGNEVVACIAYNYGSKHNDQEHLYAKRTALKNNIPFHRVNLDFSLFESDLLKKGGDIPEGHYEAETMKQTVVPFRNGIMLAYSAGIADSLGADAVILGNHAGDHHIYKDCRQEFITPMAEAIEEGTDNGILLLSPLVNLSKTEVAALGESLGVDWADTYSCYKGGGIHCGLCSTCQERQEAFIQAGITDPTSYVDTPAWVKEGKTEVSRDQ